MLATALAIPLAAYPGHSRSQVGGLDAKLYDKDQDGEIDAGSELSVYSLHKENPILRQIDTDRDGRISPAEADAYLDTASNAAIPTQVDLDALRAGRSGIPVAEANATLAPPTRKPDTLNGILIRRSIEDIGVVRSPLDYAKFEGALAAYQRDFEANNDIWQFRGAVMYPFRTDTGLKPSSQEFSLAAYSIVPAISLDKVSNDKDSSKNVDSLVFRFGSEGELAGGSAFETQYIRGFALYGTDTHFDSDILGGELEWEPTLLRAAVGVARPIFGGSLEFRWRPILHTEGGYIADADNNTKLEGSNEYLRIGPKLQFSVWPTFKQVEKFALNVNYTYLYGISGEQTEMSLFETGLSYRLDDLGQAKIELNYRNGEAPLVATDTDTLTLGFSLKY